jgi:thioredoxin 1
MKKLLFYSGVALFLLSGLVSCHAKNDSSNNAAEKAIPFEKVSQNVNSTGGAVKLTKDVFLQKVWNYVESPREWKYKGEKPALIDFYADWCGPCKIASPILEELSKEYAGEIIVYKVDTEVERELASVFGIRGIPAFLYIPMNGKPLMMSGVARSKEETKAMFKTNIDKYLLATE